MSRRGKFGSPKNTFFAGTEQDMIHSQEHAERIKRIEADSLGYEDLVAKFSDIAKELLDDDSELVLSFLSDERVKNFEDIEDEDERDDIIADLLDAYPNLVVNVVRGDDEQLALMHALILASYKSDEKTK